MKPEIWAQLKNITVEKLLSSLEKDGWVLRTTGSGSRRIYTKGLKIVSVHYHPHKSYGPKQLREILEDIDWTELDLKRLKLIK